MNLIILKSSYVTFILESFAFNTSQLAFIVIFEKKKVSIIVKIITMIPAKNEIPIYEYISHNPNIT